MHRTKCVKKVTIYKKIVKYYYVQESIFDLLSPELIIYIMDYLHTSDKISLVFTCRDLYNKFIGEIKKDYYPRSQDFDDSLRTPRVDLEELNEELDKIAKEIELYRLFVKS